MHFTIVGKHTPTCVIARNRTNSLSFKMIVSTLKLQKHQALEGEQNDHDTTCTEDEARLIGIWKSNFLKTISDEKIDA